MTPPPPAPSSLRVVSYNVHALYVASRHRARRMRAIAAMLRELDPDVVALQEAFVGSDRRALVEALRDEALPHRGYYPSGVVGSGLMVLARAPLAERGFHAYRERGAWWKPWQGDWYAGKGVAMARLALAGGELQLFNTHAIAGYGPLGGEHHGQRCAQMVELADFVRARTSPELPALVVGDLNAACHEAPYRIARRLGRLRSLSGEDADGIDHVLAVASERHAIEPMATEFVRETTLIGARRVPLSDHPAVVVDLRVAPAASARARLLAAG